MIFINSMFNQDAGVPIFPTEFIEDISKLRKEETFEFLDLNILVYRQLNEYRVYEQLKFILGGYTKFLDLAENTTINTYRYEALPTIEIITYIIVFDDLRKEKFIYYLSYYCKEYGLEFDITYDAIKKLIECLKKIANSLNISSDSTVYLNMDSVSAVGVGLIFASFLKGKNIIGVGNQINVPEVANFALSLDVINEVVCTHVDYNFHDSKKFLSTLKFVKDYIYLYPLYYGIRIIPFKLTEGCSQICNFCTERMFWSYKGKIVDKFKQRNLEDSLQEIKYIIESMDVDGLTFNDCMVDFSLPKYSSIVSYLIKSNVFCSGSTRIDCLSGNRIEILNCMNFTNLIIGLETFNQSSVDAYNKGNSNYLKDFQHIFRKLKENGIEPQINIVYDHPFEKEKDVIKAIEADNLALQNLKENDLYILDLSIGDMLINYPSDNYINIMGNIDYDIVYHKIDDDNIKSHIRNSISKVPYKAISKYVTEIRKNDCVRKLYNIMDYSTDIPKRLKTLEKHWENINRVWLKRNIYIKKNIKLCNNIHVNIILDEILNNEQVKYETLIETVKDIQEIVSVLLALYFANIVSFVEGENISNEK